MLGVETNEDHGLLLFDKHHPVCTGSGNRQLPQARHILFNSVVYLICILCAHFVDAQRQYATISIK